MLCTWDRRDRALSSDYANTTPLHGQQRTVPHSTNCSSLPICLTGSPFPCNTASLFSKQESLFQAGLAERNWWSDLKHWAVNDIPPGISENDTSNTKRAYITSTVLHVLQELRQAKQERDTPRVKALQVFLRDTAQQLALPFHLCGTIVVPNLTKLQKTVITNIVPKILHASPLKAYERQALKHSVRIVHSNPRTVKSLFQTHAMCQTRHMKRPPCRCHDFSARAPEFGKVLHIDGHAALLPAIFAVGGHENLRPNDPVPVPGRRARAQAVSGITDFCKHLHTYVRNVVRPHKTWVCCHICQLHRVMDTFVVSLCQF